MFQTIAIIGLGLIGSSLAYDIRSHRLAKRLVGIDPNPEAEKALAQVLDVFATEPSRELVREADFVILATPPDMFEEAIKRMAAFLSPQALLTDVGSVKQHAVEAIVPNLPGGVTYISSHPIAGSEKSGPGSGKAGLFLHRRVILTPYRADQDEPLKKMAQFWQSLGGVCEVMPADIHDLIYAQVSHMPQVVAYAAMLTIADHQPKVTDELKKFLRIAGSPPKLWRSIIATNRKCITDALEILLKVVSKMRQELGDGMEQGAPSAASPEGVVILFPRMVASALIHAVHFCEHTFDMKLARYAGQGFKDMTAVVQSPPEEDIEKISGAYGQLYELLMAFEKHLDAFLMLIRQEDWGGFERKGGEAQQAYRQWA